MAFPLLLALLAKGGATAGAAGVMAGAGSAMAATAAASAAPAIAAAASAAAAAAPSIASAIAPAASSAAAPAIASGATGGAGKALMSLLSSGAEGSGLSKTAAALSSIGKNGIAKTIRSGAIREALPELGKKILTNALSEDPDGQYVAPFLNGGVTFGKGVGEGVKSYLDSSGIMSREGADSISSGVDAILNRVKMRRAMQ